MPLLAARSLYEAPAISVQPPVEGSNFIASWDWWPKQKAVQLVGVAAHPRVGSGTVRISEAHYVIPPQFEYPREVLEPTIVVRKTRVKKQAPPPPVTIVVSLVGTQATAAVGSGTIKTVFELLEDELVALMEIAA